MSQHILMSEKEGQSYLASQAAPEFNANDFPEGWSGAGVEASGVFMFILKVDKESDTFELHASEDAWLAYVVSGSGTLLAGTADEQRTESVAYAAGDFITFEANTPHGWINNIDAESRLLFVKQA
ncbi:cupin domain-containing protein [Echinimonas agarilytica]|uniref:Cupin domain-containing protein n=1 Tax=Echinimonas agarilytica TaxID=1215918 RepID=A0AA41W4I8_9GAMM|nr:cupin domain-containing protein [Echinimonas agarilytica]MCM2678509.1 cupin domain-containing protein [Echinimonas agarilytica]